MASFSQIQHPRLKGETTFQAFCLKLIRRVWKDDYAELHGRRGQQQDGADITGTDHASGYAVAAMQCKGSETNNPRVIKTTDIDEEVRKAKGFIPPLNLLVIAYAGDRDEALNRHVIAINKAHTRHGLFKVVLWAWDDLVDRAAMYPDVEQALLVELGILVPTSIDPKRPKSASIEPLTEIASVLTELTSRLQDGSPTGTISATVAEAKIDVWRDQIRAGNGHTVIEPLKEFIKTLDEANSPHACFRAHANLGAALAQTGAFELASIQFDKAADAELGTADSHSYRARAAMMRERMDVAFKEANVALSIDATSRHAASILIECAPDDVAPSELEGRIGELARTDDVGAALSNRYSNAGEHNDALRIARQIPRQADPIRRNAAIGLAILMRFEGNISLRLGGPAEPEDIELLKEARDLLTVAWNTAKKRADVHNWVHLAPNLGTAYRLLGDSETSDALALEAHAIQPDSVQLIERATIAHINRGEADTALELAEGLAESGGADEALFAANVAASAKAWSTVLRLAQAAYDLITNDDDKARAADLIVLATYRQSDPATALKMADTLRPSLRPSIAFEARSAELARRLGETAAIEAARERIAAFDTSTLGPLERFELADAYGEDGNWSGAAELLKDFHTLDRPSEPLRRRLFALFRADERSAARSLYESLDAPALESKDILELGAAIYERSGMLPEALREMEKSIALEPKAIRPRLEWAQLCIRSDQEAKVRRWVKNAQTEKLDGDAQDKVELALLYDRYSRRKDALALGYDTLRRHWGESERVHLGYMSLFLMRFRAESFLQPKTVERDSVVVVRDAHGAEATYRIEEGVEPSQGVLQPDHAFATQLLGKAIGDKIVQVGQGWDTREWTVVGIKHKYLDLFHSALNSHQTFFPESRAFGSVHIDPSREDQFEPIFERARDRAKVANDASKLYEEGVVPVDVIAKVLGISPIDASRGLRHRSNITLETCSGGDEERRAVLAAVKDTDAFLVDPITLSIWQEVGLLDVVAKLDGVRIEVVQSTLDMIAQRAEIARQEMHQRGGSLEAADGRFILHESTKASRQALLDHHLELITWCRNHTTVIPTEPLTVEDADDLSEVLSKASIDTIATALAGRRNLIIDDRRLRNLARSLGIGGATWTHLFVMQLVGQEKIRPDQYVEVLAKLHKNRVGFVAISSDDLEYAAARGDLEVFTALADAVTGKTVDPHSIVSVVGIFTHQIWLEPTMTRMRDSFVSRIFYRLVCREDGIEIFAQIVREVRDSFRSLPFPLRLIAVPWNEYCKGFAVGHFIFGAAVTKGEKRQAD